MSNLSDLHCAFCDHPLERVRYFCRQLLTADDMTVEQEYFRQKLRRHNRYLHGFGVACGLTVEPAPDAAHPWQVRVCPGYAVAPQGDEILVPAPTLYDLATGRQDEPCAPCPCPPVPHVAGDARQIVYLGAKYSECSTRPVRVHPAGCGCDDCACDYSRIRDDFCLGTLCEIPDCYLKQAKADVELIKRLKAFKAALGGAIENYANLVNSNANGAGLFGAGQFTAVHKLPPALPVPDCLCCADPWVILATIQLPANLSTPIAAHDIHYLHRRVLYSESALFWAALAT
jgi:hypothetical protein